MVEYHFFKYKIPQNYSYPLKRSHLDERLEKADLKMMNSVSYVFNHQRDDLILRGWFSGEAHKGWAGSGHTRIWLWAVPSAQRKEIEQVILNEALPSLLAWLQKAEQEGNVWRARSRHLDFRYFDNRLVVEEF